VGDILYLILRRLRAPLITLIAVYAISVAGLVAIPGADAQGQPWRMGFFHAFYVMSYTATTIGFGEIPYAFTDPQRLWVTFSIYLSVIGWAYAIGSVFSLTQDAAFRAAVARSLFARRVRRLREPFHLICGYGQSGASLARALDALGTRLVIVDDDEQRIAPIALEEYQASPLVLVADARLPQVLELAGVRKPECRAVLALTRDDEVNQAVAIGARVANPTVPVVVKVTTDLARGNLEAIGGVQIVDPFQAFAENLKLDFTSPTVLQVEEWLTGVPGSRRPESLRLPRGHWVLGGYGRFGRAAAQVLGASGLSWDAIDPRLPAALPHVSVTPDAEDALREAGIERAVGLLACTDVDSTNLALARLAKRLKPDVEVVIRRNRIGNRSLIDAAGACLQFVQSDVMTHECLQILTSPLLSRLIALVRHGDAELAERVRALLEQHFGDRVPCLWAFDCDANQPGMRHALFDVKPGLTVGDLLRDPRDPSQPLVALPLLVLGGDGGEQPLPPPGASVTAGDRILFAGEPGTEAVQRRFLLDPSPIDYVRTGREPARGWLFRKLARNGGQSSSSRAV
jgi:Trk K+ transport system NAD-binding subunit